MNKVDFSNYKFRASGLVNLMTNSRTKSDPLGESTKTYLRDIFIKEVYGREKLDIKTNVDLDQIPGILEEEMKNRNMTEEIKKIIAVLQNLNGKKIWNLNCILSGMGILSAHVEDESRSVLKMEKKSLLEIMKKVPVDALRKQMPKQVPGSAEEAGEESINTIQIPQQDPNQPQIQSDSEEIKEKIKKLEELEVEIEKEKDELEKEIAEKNAKKKAGTSKAKADKINKAINKALKTAKTEAKPPADKSKTPAKSRKK